MRLIDKDALQALFNEISISDDEWGDIIYDEVIAWMPLPKPLKGADDE